MTARNDTTQRTPGTLRAQNAALREAMERISSALETAGEYSGGAQVARNIAGAALQQSAPQGEGK